MLRVNFLLGRGGGIRTPGTSRYNGFQDRRDRPLCHSSVRVIFSIRCAKVYPFPFFDKSHMIFSSKCLIFLVLIYI